jgi:UDP-N-acetylglucosamine:LPS N-acetylglucosamine transferase
LAVGSGAAIRMEVMPRRQKANQENERKQEQNSQITVLGGSSID